MQEMLTDPPMTGRRDTELQVTAIFLGESFEYTLSAGMQEVLTDPPMTCRGASSDRNRSKYATNVFVAGITARGSRWSERKSC